MNNQDFVSANILKWLLFYLAGVIVVGLFYISIPRTSLQVSSQPRGKFVNISRVSLAKPGFVVLLRPTEELGYGDFVGNSEYLLPGIYEDINIAIDSEDPSTLDALRAVIYLDNGNKYLDQEETPAKNVFGKTVRKLINFN